MSTTPADPAWAARPETRFDRPRLDEEEIERVRQERLAPQITQWDYLHLSGLRRGLGAAFRAVGPVLGPCLDLFCGTKPYLEMIRSQPVWGLDLDLHFGRADVLGSVPLPFRDSSFGVVVCSQALHLVDDPRRTVDEMHRVLRPGGAAIVTVPHLFIAEGDFERHWSPAELRGLFDGGWDVEMRGVGGPGAALAFVVGRLAMLVARRVRVSAPLFKWCMVVMNTAGEAIDLLLSPFHRRWPHGLVLVARRRPHHSASG
jgi:SAM-dependent methyltransferase